MRRNVEQHVGRLRIVVVGGESEGAAPQADIQTDVVLRVLLPAQVVVSDLRGIDLRSESVAEIDVRRAVERQVFRIADLSVTGLSHAGADFQVVDPFHIAQEALVAHAPSHGGRREITPPGVGGEARRTVAADRGRNHVTALVGVLRTHEPRGEGVRRYLLL